MVISYGTNLVNAQMTTFDASEASEKISKIELKFDQKFSKRAPEKERGAELHTKGEMRKKTFFFWRPFFLLAPLPKTSAGGGHVPPLPPRYCVLVRVAPKLLHCTCSLS